MIAEKIKVTRKKNGVELNRLEEKDKPAHDWYRFVLSYPPHLVRQYLERFDVQPHQRVLDPFCGTGTTVVECKKLGINSVGIEANPIACFASQTKVDWTPNPDGLLAHSQEIAEIAARQIKKDGIDDVGKKTFKLRLLSPELDKLLLTNSISPIPLHKTLVLLQCLEKHRDERFYRHEVLALAKALVGPIGNLHFGPEVGVGAAKADAPVLSAWLHGIERITKDLSTLRELEDVEAIVHHADARDVLQVVQENSCDVVITSPPYPNEKDYTRTTRLESVLLGFISSKSELQDLKKGLVRSNTRSVYKADTDDLWVSLHPEIQRIANDIEARRIELGKTSGFERLYPRVTKLYFGGMARHLADLRHILRPNAHLAYVVGDQASYLRVMIRTGQLLADIAESLGYEVVGIDLFRTRIATATKEQMREEVVVLRWPGGELRPSKYSSKELMNA